MNPRAFTAGDSDDDEDAPTIVDAVEDEAVQYNDDLRSQFPMAFGANPLPRETGVP